MMSQSQDTIFAREATNAFRQRAYATAVSILKQLPVTDPRVSANLAVAEYYHALQHHAGTADTINKLEATINTLYESYEARDSSPVSYVQNNSNLNTMHPTSLEDDWAVKDHDDGYDDEELDTDKLPSLPSAVADSAWARYNRACMLFYKSQCVQASQVLTPIFENHIEKLDDYIAVRIMLLLADVQLRLNKPQVALQIANHLERHYVSIGEHTFPSSRPSKTQMGNPEDDENSEYDDEDYGYRDEARAQTLTLEKQAGSQLQIFRNEEDYALRRSAVDSTRDAVNREASTASPTPPNINNSPSPISPTAYRATTPINDSEGSETGPMSPTPPILALPIRPSPDRDPVYRPGADDALPSSSNNSFEYTIRLIRGRALLILGRPKAANREFAYAKRIQQDHIYQYHSQTATSPDRSKPLVNDVLPWHLHAKGEWNLQRNDEAMKRLDKVRTMQFSPVEPKETEHGIIDVSSFSDKYWWNAMGILASEEHAKALALLSFVRAHSRNTEHMVNINIVNPLCKSCLLHMFSDLGPT